MDELVSLRHNGMIKVITGMRRCGKSYLLFEIFASWLENEGIASDHIIKVDLEDYKNREMRNPDNLYAYMESRIADDAMYYLLLDEVQMLDKFEDVLNGFLRMRNVDVYVTGSNAKFLSKDIATEFRGRGCLFIRAVSRPASMNICYMAVFRRYCHIIRKNRKRNS